MIDDEGSGKTDKLREIDWGVAENSTNNRQLFFSLCLSLSRALALSLSHLILLILYVLFCSGSRLVQKH